MKRILNIAFVIAIFPVLALAQEKPQQESIAVTVYSNADPRSFDPQRFIAQQRQGYNPLFATQVPGFAVVKEQRSVDLKRGRNELRFTDVAQFIDPTTVNFSDLTAGDSTAVLEQRFEFDLVSPNKLLERYIDHEITAVVQKGDDTEEVSGKLLSASQNQLVLQTAAGLQMVSRYGPQLLLGKLPDGLITKPTLVWDLHAQKGGKHSIRTAYQTDGITWRSDYSVILNKKDSAADVSSWVTLMNLSGAAYSNAALKLIAGDVQRVQAQGGLRQMRKVAAMEMEAIGSAVGFQEKSFFEYHLYTLPRKLDIPANTTQQISLFPPKKDVQVKKILVYYGLPGAASWGFLPSPRTDRNLGGQVQTKVDVYVQFKNEEKNKLGIPLPKGKVRVYKQDDADGTLEFIGEDLIDHTAKDEKVLVRLGQSFDVVGERKQTDFQVDWKGEVMTETFRIELRNHKEEAQEVVIRENLFRWINWKVIKKSDDFEKIDARTIHFPVTVPANGKKVVTYSVRYTW